MTNDENEFVSFQTPYTKCTGCGNPGDWCFGDQGRPPASGDFVVCIACDQYMVFDDELKLRNLDEEETEFVEENAHAFRRARDRVKAMRPKITSGWTKRKMH